ncbi:mannonate dehydratase [Kushneria pakistanensis]|uniref:Mannonate dehydratase n=1 Tax=Kushneria pakistanensis TaxID=1508770 RepID=A0ABQ3FM82_9GAMM|nr:mannonate dehydratase [Kushneria pakistanensis]GHC29235.1 mannonate dehydratase [Kushneria pakistanensis]
MEHTWRWFGPDDPVTLSEIRQAGATGIVTALHGHDPRTPWSVEAIVERKALIEAAGLSWSVVESVPVPEAIKQALDTTARDRAIEVFCTTLENLAACGIDTVCYNFMPILDWTRTELAWPTDTGGLALRFDQTTFAAFELFILKRPGAESLYSPDEQAAARRCFERMDDEAQKRLVTTLIAGLPGADQHYTLAQFLENLRAYEAIDAERLRSNYRHFLQKVVPVAERLGMRLAVHPDDPPRPLLGLPRIVSTAEDARWVLDQIKSPANGLTFCTGSYGVREDNDLIAMAREFAPHIHFVHLRATRRDADDPLSFIEAEHLDGDVDMVGVIGELVKEERRRLEEGGARLPMRPDHGHMLCDDIRRTTNPGYPLIGRLKGLAELRGVECAVRRFC